MAAFLEFITKNPEETQQLGRRLGELAESGDVFLLVGKLGAGKTCLTQGIAKGLGITESVLSPSFVLMREFKGRISLYHADLYRLERIQEISELGLDEYLYGNGLTGIEWADRGLDVMPDEYLLIEITYGEGDERKFKLTACGRRYEELLIRIKYKG